MLLLRVICQPYAGTWQSTCVLACDRLTDRQTERRTHDDIIYRASIASRGKNLHCKFFWPHRLHSEVCMFVCLLNRSWCRLEGLTLVNSRTKEPCIRWSQDRTNAYAAAVGYKSAMRPFVKIFWSLVNWWCHWLIRNMELCHHISAAMVLCAVTGPSVFWLTYWHKLTVKNQNIYN